MNIMAKSGFKCVQDSYGNKRDELFYARIYNYGERSSPWEQSNINYEDRYEDNMHQKINFKAYPYKHEISDFEKLENHCGKFCNTNAAFGANETSNNHYETEKKYCEKRNRYLPRRFSDYYIEMPQHRRDYLGKTLPSRSKICLKNLSKNDDFFQPSENQYSRFNKNSREYDDDSRSKYHNERDNFVVNNRSFLSYQDNHVVENCENKGSYTHTASPKKWEKIDDFEHSESHDSYFSKNCTDFGDYRDSKYYTDETISLCENSNSRFATNPDNLKEILQSKKSFLTNTQISCARNSVEKWTNIDDFEKSGNQYSCFNQNTTEFGDYRDTKYHHERNDFVGNKSYLSSNLKNHLIGTPEKERTYLRKAPHFPARNFEEKWGGNDDFEQSRYKYSYDCKNDIEFGDGRVSNYYHGNTADSLTEKYSSIHSHSDNYFSEIPQKTNDCLRKMPSPYTKNCKIKRETNENFEQSGNKCSFFTDKTTVASDNNDTVYKQAADTKLLIERNSDLPRHSDNYFKEMPQKKGSFLKTTPSSRPKNNQREWEKNDDFEQSKYHCTSSCDKITVAFDKKGSNHSYEADINSFREKHSSSVTHLDNYSVETPKKKRRSLRKILFPTEKNCDEIGDTEQSEIQCNLPFAKRSLFGDNKICQEACTKDLRERNASLPGRFKDFLIETPKKKQSNSKKTPSSSSKNIHKKRNEKSSNKSENSFSYFSNCTLFENSDFVNQIKYYNDEEWDGIFVAEESKDAMLCSVWKSTESSIIREKHKADDDIVHNCDCAHIFDKDLDFVFATEKVEDVELFSYYRIETYSKTTKK